MSSTSSSSLFHHLFHFHFRIRLFLLIGAFSLLLPLIFVCRQMFFAVDEYPRFLVPIHRILLKGTLSAEDGTVSDERDPQRIAFLSVLDHPNSLSEFQFALSTVRCYCLRHPHKYSHILLFSPNNERSGRCAHISEFMFRRHCVVAEWMRQNSIFEWILFLDADIGVVNPTNHRIEEYMGGASSELVLLDRMFNYEIMAGTYLAKNSPFVHNFLHSFANYSMKLPNSFHGSDNGAIHALMMERYADRRTWKTCQDLWEKSSDYEELFLFEACTRFYTNWTMRGRRTYDGDRIIELPKGRGWVRDGGPTGTRFSARDFMLHGWKNSTFGKWAFNPWLNPFTNEQRFDRPEICQNISIAWKYKSELFVGQRERLDIELEALVQKSEQEYNQTLKRLKLIE